MYYRGAIILSLAGALLLAGALFWGTRVGCWLIILSQVILFARFWRESVTGLGSFVFMSVLFFAIRPMYLLVEQDYDLLTDLFLIFPNTEMIHRNLFWSAAGLTMFVVSGLLARKVARKLESERRRRDRGNVRESYLNLSDSTVLILIVAQACALLLMFAISRYRMALYGSALGAYIYDLPAVLQGGSVMCVLISLERWKTRRSMSRLLQLVFAASVFLLITLMMRDVSMFRSFYLTGSLIAIIAVLARLRSRVGYGWLVIPIIMVLPLFRLMGQLRYEVRTSLSESVQQRREDVLSAKAYWQFFDASGDMNIFDSFIAASEIKPRKHPYILSWLYVPFHLIPRKLWPGKPENGILQDHSFSNGAPYSPGIAGYFVLDGGRVWMLGSMALLGFLVSMCDMVAIRIRVAYLRCCVYAIFVVNGMLLTRVFLWQYFYQVFYMLFPCLMFSLWTRKQLVVRGKGGNDTVSDVSRACA